MIGHLQIIGKHSAKPKNGLIGAVYRQIPLIRIVIRDARVRLHGGMVKAGDLLRAGDFYERLLRQFSVRDLKLIADAVLAGQAVPSVERIFKAGRKGELFVFHRNKAGGSFRGLLVTGRYRRNAVAVETDVVVKDPFLIGELLKVLGAVVIIFSFACIEAVEYTVNARDRQRGLRMDRLDIAVRDRACDHGNMSHVGQDEVGCIFCISGRFPLRVMNGPACSNDLHGATSWSRSGTHLMCHFTLGKSISQFR